MRVPVQTVDMGRPDRQLCYKKLWDFRWKSFLFKSRIWTVRHSRPDGRTSAASNFHIRLSRVQTNGDGRPDGWSSTRNFHICGTRVRTVEVKSAISISVERASGPWQTDVRTVEFELGTCLMETRVRTGNHVIRTVEAIFPYLHLERIGSLIDYCDVRTDASWNRSFSIQWRVPTEIHVVWTDDAWSVGVQTVWHVVRTDGTVDRWASGWDDTSSGRLTRNLILLTCK